VVVIEFIKLKKTTTMKTSPEKATDEKKKDEQIKAILFLLETHLQDQLDEVQKSNALIELGAKTALIKELEKDIEDPFQNVMNVALSVNRTALSLLHHVFKSHLLKNANLVRMDQVQQAGFGEVCRFYIQTDPNMAVATEPLLVWLTDAQIVNSQLGQHAVTTVNDSTIVTQNLTGTVSNGVNIAPQIFPNPAQDAIQISQPAAQLYEATVMDMNGKLIFVQNLQEASLATVGTTTLADGVFLLRITSSLGTYMQKLVIAR
jgi:hypothetical protein